MATQIFYMFTPTWGNDPIWLIFFRGVETTNQVNSFQTPCSCPNLASQSASHGLYSFLWRGTSWTFTESTRSFQCLGRALKLYSHTATVLQQCSILNYFTGVLIINPGQWLAKPFKSEICWKHVFPSYKRITKCHMTSWIFIWSRKSCSLGLKIQ